MMLDTFGEQVTAVLVALVGSGGLLSEVLRRRSKNRAPIPREEAEEAVAAQHLDTSTQIVTAALTERINAIQIEFEHKLNLERRARREETSRLEEGMSALEGRYSRLHAWASDMVARWDFHRQYERPPVLPD